MIKMASLPRMGLLTPMILAKRLLKSRVVKLPRMRSPMMVAQKFLKSTMASLLRVRSLILMLALKFLVSHQLRV